MGEPTMTQQGPKPAFVDENGVPWWNFLFAYEWEGKTYGFDICARSEEEAKARLKRLPLARYDGQADGDPIPVNAATRVYVPFLVWWKNFRQRIFDA
jgi:hypothetical protein